MMDIFAEFLNAPADMALTPWRAEIYEDQFGSHAGWAALQMGGWREPDLGKFTDLFYAAADYHLAESRDMETKGHDNDHDQKENHFEFENDAYWLYPVILFTVLRLREWSDLPSPARLTHPLFANGVFKNFPRPLDWPKDSFHDAIDLKFRAEFPKTTPDQTYLPELKRIQQ